MCTLFRLTLNSLLGPCVSLISLISLCTKEPTRFQSLGSLARLSLRVREKWLKENVSGGLQFGPHVRGILPSARLYSTAEAFTCGVAQHFWVQVIIRVSCSLCNFLFLPPSLLMSPRILEGLRVWHTQRGTCALDAPLPSSFLFADTLALRPQNQPCTNTLRLLCAIIWTFTQKTKSYQSRSSRGISAWYYITCLPQIK